MTSFIEKTIGIVKSIAAALTLIAVVYIGAVSFLTAVVTDKLLILINSRYTVEILIEKVDVKVQSFMTGYKNWVSQYDIDPSKIKLFK